MIFNAKDIQQFIKEKEFIDTALVPLLFLTSDESQLAGQASSADFLMHFTHQIEKQFKGRMVLLPPVVSMDESSKETILRKWNEATEKMGFRHTFFVTTDLSLLSVANDFSLFCIPSVPLESMDAKLKASVLDDQLRQIVPQFASKWTNL